MGCQPDGMHGPCPGGSFRMDPTLLAPSAAADHAVPPPSRPNTMTGRRRGWNRRRGPAAAAGACGNNPSVPQVVGEPIAVAFAGDGTLVVQSREPAMLALPGGATDRAVRPISQRDTGHLVFHANAGGSLACASCHAEGNDDGRVWNFTCEGPRRTQSLHGRPARHRAVPLERRRGRHHRLMEDVFVGRMSGPLLAPDQTDALLTWIDSQPRPLRTAPGECRGGRARPRAVQRRAARAPAPPATRARASPTTQTVDVGTGGAFQVPSLVGIGTRGPFMHNGCAKTLRDRFDPACGGGDRHGITSDLTDGQISDLVAYLESI